MKKLIVSVVMLFMATSMFAQEQGSQVRVPSGYQGFLEYGNSWHVFDKEMPNTINLSTTHGFYLNGHLFIGIGIGIDACNEIGLFPVYANMRYVMMNKTVVSPILSFRLGSYISENVGPYGDLALGVRFASKRDFAVSLLIAATYYDKLTYNVWENFQDQEGFWHNQRIGKTVNPSSVSLRIGIEW